MAGLHIATFSFLHLVIFQAVRLGASVQTFNGIAEVIFEVSNYSLSDDFVINLDTSLESLLSGLIDDVMVSQNERSEADRITISFRGYFDDFETIPVCLQNNSFYYENEITNVSYSVGSVSMQNFRNNFEDECTNNERNVAYFEYIEEDCQFKKLECESSYELNGVYRYGLNKRGSVLYSFFCVSVVPYEEGKVQDCFDFVDWLQVEWKQKSESTCTIDEMSSKVFRPSFAFIDDNELNELVPIYTFPTPFFCVSFTFGPPTIPLHGDQTWDKLPEWLKVCLRVLNCVSLGAFLFCLLTFVMFKELRNTHGKNVLSLVTAGILSLFYTSGYIPLVTANRGLCVFLATLIYYFVLVPNYWWTAVAIFLAWTLGRKGIHRMDEDSGNRFFLLLSILGWGLPLIFALLAAFLHVGGVKVFDVDEYCWIIAGWPNYLITAQTLIPFIVDCALFVLVVYRLRETRLDVASMHSGGKNKRGNERQLTIKMAAIFGVFWLPSWIIYVTFLFYPIISLAIIAQLLNQLSTFVLPIVLCCNKRVVALWKVKLAPLRDRLGSLTPSIIFTDSHSTQKDPVREKPFIDRNEPPVDGKEIQLHEIDDK